MDVIYGCVWCDSQYACMPEEKDKLPYTEMTIIKSDGELRI